MLGNPFQFTGPYLGHVKDCSQFQYPRALPCSKSYAANNHPQVTAMIDACIQLHSKRKCAAVMLIIFVILSMFGCNKEIDENLYPDIQGSWINCWVDETNLAMHYMEFTFQQEHFYITKLEIPYEETKPADLCTGEETGKAVRSQLDRIIKTEVSALSDTLKEQYYREEYGGFIETYNPPSKTSDGQLTLIMRDFACYTIEGLLDFRVNPFENPIRHYRYPTGHEYLRASYGFEDNNLLFCMPFYDDWPGLDYSDVDDPFSPYRPADGGDICEDPTVHEICEFVSLEECEAHVQGIMSHFRTLKPE